MGANTSGASLMENMSRLARILTAEEEGESIVSTPQEVRPLSFDVYTLDGKCLVKGASHVGDLPKGLYIINGKKVLF